MKTIQIAAVGDILMWHRQIESVKLPGQNRYSFRKMFAPVRGQLASADLTIGNLETTLSGRETHYERTNPATHYPMFNCPDELANALVTAGFDVLTTANNHCMDRSEAGLKRTLQILNRHHIRHTGTFSSRTEAKQLLVMNVQGLKIGLLAYTYGTNMLLVPTGKPWLVNRIRWKQIAADLSRLRRQADLLIVSIHFGREFHHRPSANQKKIVQQLFYHGADIVLGAHPHVLQRMEWRTVEDKYGVTKRRFVAYSLGNFISERMNHNLFTQLGVIVRFDVHQNRSGRVELIRARAIPTWTKRDSINGRSQFRVVPVRTLLKAPQLLWTEAEKQAILGMLHRTIKTAW